MTPVVKISLGITILFVIVRVFVMGGDYSTSAMMNNPGVIVNLILGSILLFGIVFIIGSIIQRVI